ncbi:double-stranded RNA-specific adenosine deaminase-like isoform X2 [Mizuhopecten yessoensis]|uniref:double-stranded RNA-specific adenosine deaminase-like isoform X2 n=1 Tax=Mizuhopecten yessoensis TaxID=6573 RepID=UPI000B459324|nr:double-stranded RNA-specific adenosine deaminase-like isoform X2 [Mizuhopecten yessoensis]
MAEGWREHLDNINKNCISRLQEYAAKRGSEVRYETYPSQGGFGCKVYFAKFIASGTGDRKKEAEEAAADRALRSLYKNSGTNQPQSNQQPSKSLPEIIYSRQSASASDSDGAETDAHSSTLSDVSVLRYAPVSSSESDRSSLVSAWDEVVQRSNSNYVPTGSGSKHPVSEFMEYAQANGEVGRIEEEFKCGSSHCPTFTVQAYIGKRKLAEGTGSSKKKARWDAAESSLNMLAPRPSPRALTYPGFSLAPSPPIIDKNAGICPAGADPISILNEFAQKKGLELTFPDPDVSGADHERMFTLGAILDNVTYPRASASTIKEAKREASRTALRHLKQKKIYQFTSGLSAFSISEPLTFHDRIAKLCHEKFNTVVADIPENLAGRKVIAGIVMETKTTNTFDVISIASGNRFIKGDALTTDGHVLVDSHAEILAARGMRKFLYYHLTKLSKGEKSTVLQRIEGEQAELAPDIQFHLYISTAPCGDGATFTHSSGQSEVEPDGSHNPIFDDNKQGLLRTKVEQGTLYNHGHIARAMCCRLEKSCRIRSLPDGYKVNHPLLGAVSRTKEPLRSVEKSTALCINWNSADECAELTNGTTGVPNISSGFAQHKADSRLCKQGMLRSYAEICRSAGLLELVKDDYLETKNVSKRYQRCKKALYESLHNQEYGTWVGLPRECQQFSTSCVDDMFALCARQFTHSDNN